ncbi:MAG: Inner membrane transport protein YajR [Syntrophorhabdus sp. PtaU1.Bin058]|nr:MAG: Inner membrane transport protein YajR [Syntrophorhabdus sp. PtaU1.Bin058]
MAVLIYIGSMRSLMERTFRGINRNIVAISLVSLLNDISSEMVYPVIPIFLVAVLNAPVTIVGLIEGIAESTANLLRIFSGYFSDRSGKRKPFMTGGYALSALSKLIIASASGWTSVMAGRFLDRFGKGVRTAARDALLAGTSQERYRGRVFGFHRALDTMGAVVGPLIAFFLLKAFEDNLRFIFYLAFIPAAAGVVLLLVFVRDIKRATGPGGQLPWRLRDMRLNKGFKVFLLASTIFALGNSSDAFIILRAHNLGFAVGTTILAYALFNIVYAVLSHPAGIISDRVGQKKVLLWGFALFALIYLLLGIVEMPAVLWVLFPMYGVYMALTEGIGKAYISLHAKDEFTGTIYGIYQTLTGITALPASLTAGFLWRYVSPGAPFIFGGAMALAALMIFGLVREDSTEKA